MGEFIKVTHFINPHLFCYQIDKPSEYADIKYINAELNKFFQNVQAETHYKPKVSDAVAVFFFRDDQYIRAEVKSVVHTNKKCDDYILWATDYGFPLQTSSEFIHPLPKKFTGYPKYVFFGGVANILPAVREMEPFSDGFVFKRQNNWSQYACESVQKLLDASSSVRFVPNSHYEISDHIWGELHIILDNETIALSDYLANKQLGMLCQTDFLELSGSMCTTKIPIWTSNNGNQNCIKNTYAERLTKNKKAIHIGDEKYCDNSKMDRVAEWIETPVKPGFDDDTTSVSEPYVRSELSIGDIHYDDSASRQNMRSQDDDSPRVMMNRGLHKAKAYADCALEDSSDEPFESTTLISFQRTLLKARQKACVSSKSVSSTNAEKKPTSSSGSVPSIHKEFHCYQKELLKSPLYPKSTKDHTGSAETNLQKMETKSTSDTYRQKKLQKFYKSRQRKPSENSSTLSDTPQRSDNVRDAHTKPESVVSVSSVNSAPLSEISGTSHSQMLLYKRQKALNNAKIKEMKGSASSTETNANPGEEDLPMRKQTTKPNVASSEQKNIENRLKLMHITSGEEAEAKADGLAANEVLSQEYISPFQPQPTDKKSEGIIYGLKMIPVGYDTRNLLKYKDPNHWHRKPTTRYDHIPHDNLTLDDSSGYISFMDNTANNTTALREVALSDGNATGNSKNDEHDVPNFRHTRPQTERHKKTANTDECLSVKSVSTAINSGENSKDNDTALNSSTLFQKNNNCIPRVDRKFDFAPLAVDELILAHSKANLVPVQRLEEVLFLPAIKSAMKRRGLTKMYRAQTYTWPHLLQNNSLILVNPKGTGKTWAYLPPICSMVKFRRSTLALTYGPAAIIMVSSSKNAQRVYSLCCDLLKEDKDANIVTALGTRNLNETKVKLLCGCDILIATTASLMRIMEFSEHESLIDYKRLQHFIIDDLDIIADQWLNDLRNVYKTLVKMCTIPETGLLSVQFVVTSCYWNPMIMVPLIQITDSPLLCIGDFLEAMTYGNMQFNVTFKKTEDKLNAVLDFIVDHPINKESLIIFCNTNKDVTEVTNHLINEGLPAIGYNDKGDVRFADMDTVLKPIETDNQLLVCCDTVFPEFKKRNVTNVIHYSMPMTWTRFTRRFGALANSLNNYVAINFNIADDNAKNNLHSYVLLDELNNMQLPRLLDFLHKHNKMDKIPPEVLSVSKSVVMQREEARVQKNFLLCPYILEFGKCHAAHCIYRHSLTKFDRIRRSDMIPTSGDIRIHILKVFSPTHYAVRILEHKNVRETQWREVQSSSKATLFALQLNMHYNKTTSLIPYTPLEYGGLCIYWDKDVSQRARVVDFVNAQRKHMNPINVTIKLLDTGDVKNVLSSQLYVCDDKFKAFPAQSMQLRLVRVQPVDNELDWDSDTVDRVRELLLAERKPGDIVSASINFALKETIFVNNIIVLESLPTIGRHVYKLNLKRTLIEKQYGVLSTELHNINKIVEEYSLLRKDDEDELEAMPENDDNQIQASIDISRSNDTQNSDPCDDEPVNIVEILKETPNENIVNANVKPVSAHDEPVPKLSTEKSNGEMPVETWCGMPMHQIVKVEIGDESENGSWENIYLQLVEVSHMKLMENLFEMTTNHVRQLRATKSIKEVITNDWYQPMRPCLVRYENNYLRAKLCGIYGVEPEKRLFKFFLCDYALFLLKAETSVFNDFLYPTTDEIVSITPYQAVHCKLAGIRLKEDTSFKVTKEFLYASAKKCLGTANVDGLKIPSYEILFYESSRDNDLKHLELFNDTIVRGGAADFNENCENCVEINNNTDVVNAPSAADFNENNENYVEINNNTDVVNAPSTADLNENNENYVEINNNTDAVNAPSAGFLDVLECFERSIELDCEDLLHDKDNKMTEEEVKKIQGFLMAQIIKLKSGPCAVDLSTPTQPMLMNVEEVPANATKQEDNEQKEITEDPAPAVCELPNDTTAGEAIFKVPTLRSLNKHPEVTWYETKNLIYLTINAPDVTKYFLEVTESQLLFSTTINDENLVLLLPFLGTVDPRTVSHEVRGLNVVVRLMKQFPVKWPALLNKSIKMPGLKYNYNCILSSERAQIQPLFNDKMPLYGDERIRGCDSSDEDDDSDDENHLFKTYTPLDNGDDLHDPIQ